MLFFLVCSVGPLCFGMENGSQEVEQPREFFAESTHSSLASLAEIHFRNPPAFVHLHPGRSQKRSPKTLKKKKTGGKRNENGRKQKVQSRNGSILSLHLGQSQQLVKTL
ncbi:hypothetical protein QBC45DRAFT_418607 [Copromyces sp. CBS 386.78]|nr:hypothetical protein QBC45DRAFT_418607 [Copromyces sp. CBS 386.78]